VVVTAVVAILVSFFFWCVQEITLFGSKMERNSGVKRFGSSGGRSGTTPFLNPAQNKYLQNIFAHILMQSSQWRCFIKLRACDVCVYSSGVDGSVSTLWHTLFGCVWQCVLSSAVYGSVCLLSDTLFLVVVCRQCLYSLQAWCVLLSSGVRTPTYSSAVEWQCVYSLTHSLWSSCVCGQVCFRQVRIHSLQV
jgi:hypothetical protein